MGENVESLGHAETKKANKTLKKKWWVAPELFRVQSMRNQDPSKYYTEEVDSFTVSQLARQHYDQGHDSIIYAG